MSLQKLEVRRGRVCNSFYALGRFCLSVCMAGCVNLHLITLWLFYGVVNGYVKLSTESFTEFLNAMLQATAHLI